MAQAKTYSRTLEVRDKFLDGLRSTASVTKAALLANSSRQHFYAWRNDDEEFAKEWQEALEMGVEALEDECRRRAFEGIDEPVFYQGVQCAVVKKYSDTLAMFMLKAHRPEKYRERHDVNVTGELTLAEKLRKARERSEGR